MPQQLFFETFENKTIGLKTDAHTLIGGVITKGWEGKRTLTLRAEKPGTTATVVLSIIGRGAEQYAFDVLSSQHSQSRISLYIRSILFDTASLQSNGTMRIEKGAHDAHAYFSHHVLLLSPGARAKVIPSLEIESDVVTAGHAVTIGRPEDDLLFYTASRGLNRAQTQELLARGFLLAALPKLPSDELRKKMTDAVETALTKKSYAKTR